MIKWFYNMGLSKKFYSTFGVIIFCSMIGIAVGQVVFTKVQIGGRYFKGIELKKDAVDDIARIRMNLNLMRSIYYEQLFKYDADSVAGLKKIASSADNLFEQLKSKQTQKNGNDKLYCTSCHSGETMAAFFTDIDNAKVSWDSFKALLFNRLIPLAAAGNVKGSIEIVEGDFSTLYDDIMEKTKNPVDTLRVVAPMQVEKLKKESTIIKVGFLIAGVLIAVFLVMIAYFLSADIVEPVVSVARLSGYMADGDFKKVDIKTKGNDEIGQMANAFQRMCSNMGGCVMKMRSGIDSLQSTAEKLSSTSEELSNVTDGQLRQADQVVALTNETSESIVNVAHNASKAADAVQESSNLASHGKTIADSAVAEINRIADSIRDAAGTIEKLGESSKEIGEIVLVITDIADQTNLLALNAAIEAARAGELGRGFAVVADEVRKLAEKTSKATSDIAQKIKIIQTETQRSVDMMKESTEEVDRGVKLMNTVSEALDSIASASSNATGMVKSIAEASEHQTTASEEIKANVDDLSGGIRHSSAVAKELSDISIELARSADYLKKEMEWIKAS
ncbi:MAG: methyl-accepting chemotaxis protein [Nitrospirae bacterium]|nr:MAG: methyl-accepting chemotaxis protein [Nitrospirota bacterium]